MVHAWVGVGVCVLTHVCLCVHMHACMVHACVSVGVCLSVCARADSECGCMCVLCVYECISVCVCRRTEQKQCSYTHKGAQIKG